MRFYRLNKLHENGESAGYEFFGDRREVEKAFREWMTPPEKGDEEWVTSREGTEIETINITPTRAGILRALQRYATHADNG
jgi:hypothetical protein